MTLASEPQARGRRAQMNRRTATVLALALASVAGTAAAGRWDRHDDRYSYADQGPRWDTARVVNVDPILAPAPASYRQQCWQQPVRFVESGGYRRNDRRDDRRYRSGGVGQSTGTVLGGIVGAAIGNQVGDGDGRRAATVAGALLGSAIARDSYRDRGYSQHNDYNNYNNYDNGYGRDSGYQRETVRYEQRCRSVQDYREDDRVVGYSVRYDYNGQLYTTQTSYHPGSTIRVRVDVVPEG